MSHNINIMYTSEQYVCIIIYSYNKNKKVDIYLLLYKQKYQGIFQNFTMRHWI